MVGSAVLSSTVFTTGVAFGDTVITNEACPLAAVAGTGVTVIENADLDVGSVAANLGVVVSMAVLFRVDPAQ